MANVKNDSVVTLIPIHDILKDQQARRLCADRAGCRQEDRPASDDDSGEQMATQWVIDSDIALTTFTSANAATGSGLTRLRALLQPRHAAGGRAS